MNPATLLWWASCWPETLAFAHSCGRVIHTQRAQLSRILTQAAPSTLGRNWQLNGREDWDDYRARVPLSQYVDYQPWIERIRGGEANLLSQQAVQLLEPTSGSQSVKLIPYTPGLRKEFQRGIAAWVGRLFGQCPALLSGRHYWSITPPVRVHARSDDRVPVGFDDDSQYLSGFSGRLVQRIMAVPPTVLQADDYLEATLDALLDCPDLSMVSVWSPSLWLMLMERLQERRGLCPNQCWPRLACISCWADGYSARFLPELQGHFPDVWIQPKGLIATEAFCSLPWGGSPVLAVRSHAFEFLDALGRSRLAHEVTQGEEYELVVTTGGGLYRYRLGDRVRVIGSFREAPRLEFRGRVDDVVDRFGEKLSQSEVLRALPQGCDGMLGYETERRSYVLFCQHPRVAQWAAELETHLQQNHFHYRVCRSQGQLEALGAYQLSPGSWEAYFARAAEMGQRPGDCKPPPIAPGENWSLQLPGGFLTDPSPRDQSERA